MKTTILFTIFTLMLAASAFAQSPVGKWKLVQCYTQLDANRTRDQLAGMYSKQPCLEKLVYVFSADGKISLEENYCADVDPEDVSGFGNKWETKSNKITVSGDDFDSMTFNLATTGNEMRWRMETDGEPAIIYVFKKQS